MAWTRHLPDLADVTKLQQLLLCAAGRPLDHLYSRLGSIHVGPFFPGGWGDLGVVDFEQDVKAMRATPEPLKVLSRGPPPRQPLPWPALSLPCPGSLPCRALPCPAPPTSDTPALLGG